MRSTLVIGYGNDLRGDDGVGVSVARAVEAWNRPDVRAREARQLLWEMVEEMKDVDTVIFVDAILGDFGSIEVLAVTPMWPPSSLSHTCEPGCLLALAQAFYKHGPSGWLITIPVVSLEHGEGLSEIAQRGKQAALTEINALVSHRARGGSQRFSAGGG